MGNSSDLAALVARYSPIAEGWPDLALAFPKSWPDRAFDIRLVELRRAGYQFHEAFESAIHRVDSMMKTAELPRNTREEWKNAWRWEPTYRSRRVAYVRRGTGRGWAALIPNDEESTTRSNVRVLG